VAQVGDGVTEQERLAPVSIFETPKGERVIDFGQNMTGVVEFVIAGKAGDRISYTCAEVLDKDGNFYNDNYRTAKNRVTYVLDGTQRVLKPKFSFQGFRYIRLEEYPADFFETVQSITAVVWHTKLQRTGHFRCGNPKVNQLYHNIIWGQKGNYLDVPTDCPQRDERLGWTGDAQVFCRTAAYNFDVRNFFRKWLGDLRLEQLENGAILGICPHLPDKSSIRISAGWGDCATIIPWELYKIYGDPGFLAENFEMMVRWVEYIRATGDNEYLWLTGYHYGDWLAMEEGMEDSYVGATANDLVATAFYAYSVSLLVRSGHILGKDMAEYEQLLQNIKKEFRAYFMPEGDLLDEYPMTELFQPGRKVIDIVRKGRTQTALTLILKFGLCEDKDKPRFAKMLDEMVEKNGGRMTTGFLGTPYILQALTENGYAGRAYDLFFQEENPSWLYSVNHGATTMWEHWNSLKEDGSFWSTNMNSFNHYAYGAVGAWMYETVAGIQMAETAAGFEKLVLAPIPDGRLGFVECAIDTVRGRVESSWIYEGDAVRLCFTVPEGVEARICLPDGRESRVTGGHHAFTVKKDALCR
jgi:alpha-L-rhamnosidase